MIEQLARIPPQAFRCSTDAFTDGEPSGNVLEMRRAECHLLVQEPHHTRLEWRREAISSQRKKGGDTAVSPTDL